MMCGGQPLDILFLHPVVQQAVAGAPGGALNAAADRHQGLQDAVRNAAFPAEGRDKFRFGASGGAQAMIDGGGSDPVRTGLEREQQQRQAVRAAGNREAQPLIAGCKSGNQAIKRRFEP